MLVWTLYTVGMPVVTLGELRGWLFLQAVKGYCCLVINVLDAAW